MEIWAEKTNVQIATACFLGLQKVQPLGSGSHRCARKRRWWLI